MASTDQVVSGYRRSRLKPGPVRPSKTRPPQPNYRPGPAGLRLAAKAQKPQKSAKHWEQNKSFKRDTLKAIRKHRWSYINNVLQLGLGQGDTKPFWKYVRAQRQDNVGVAPFLDNGVLHTDSLSNLTCILNKQFVSVFTREEVTDIPKLHGQNYPDITDLGISTEGVEKLLSNLNVSKASGPDLIPCRLLKGLAAEIAPILAEIFRQSLHDGVIPSIWKNADVAPAFKCRNVDRPCL